MEYIGNGGRGSPNRPRRQLELGGIVHIAATLSLPATAISEDSSVLLVNFCISLKSSCPTKRVQFEITLIIHDQTNIRDHIHISWKILPIEELMFAKWEHTV